MATAPCFTTFIGCPECAYVAQNVFRYGDSTRKLEQDLSAYLSSIRIPALITSRLRSCNDQARLYRTGQSRAAPTTSTHEFGYAFDMVVSAATHFHATRAQTIAYVVEIARAWGADGIAEATHAHIQVYSVSAWHAFIRARDIAGIIPIPGPRPRQRR